MKYELSTVSGLKKKLDIHLSAEQVQKTFEDQYKNKQKKVNLNGFRKGKVPISQIRAMYQDEIKKDTILSLINEFYSKALKQEQLKPASDPSIDLKSPCEEGSGFDFSIELEVQPSINIDKSFKVQLSKPSAEVTDEEVDKSLENMSLMLAKFEPVTENRPAHLGDFVELEIQQLAQPAEPTQPDQQIQPARHTSINQPLKGENPEPAESTTRVKNKKIFIELGKDQELSIKGLSEGVLGMRTGEQKKIPNVFFESAEDSVKDSEGHSANISEGHSVEDSAEDSEGHSVEDSAKNSAKNSTGHSVKNSAKNWDLLVQLKEIKKRILPPDDEIIKNLKCKDMQEAKRVVRSFIEKEKKQKIYETLKEQTLKQLVEKNPIPFLPEGLVERQKQRLISAFTLYLKREKGMLEKDIEQYVKDQEKTFQDQARFTLRSFYLIFDLVEKLNISVSPQEVRASLQTDSSGKTDNKKKYDSMEVFLTQEKVIAHLIKTAETNK